MPSKRRTPAQMAADAAAAYRATVARKHAAAVKRSDNFHAQAQKAQQAADNYAQAAELAEREADALASELARIDAAAQALTGQIVTSTDTGHIGGDYTATVTALQHDDGTLTVLDVTREQVSA